MQTLTSPEVHFRLSNSFASLGLPCCATPVTKPIATPSGVDPGLSHRRPHTTKGQWIGDVHHALARMGTPELRKAAAGKPCRVSMTVDF